MLYESREYLGVAQGFLILFGRLGFSPPKKEGGSRTGCLLGEGKCVTANWLLVVISVVAKIAAYSEYVELTEM